MAHLKVLGLLVLLLAAVAAQEAVDSVILASTLNYPDTLIAKAAGEKAGIPVLLTDSKKLPEETLSSLSSIKPTTVYLIGGPVVISSEVEDQLKASGYTVVRIWGATQVGTSLEVAKYFWPEGADDITVVEDDLNATPESGNYEDLVAASDDAEGSKRPLIVVPRGVLPSETKEALDLLKVRRAHAVGTIKALNSAGIISTPVNFSDAKIFVVVAIKSFKDVLIVGQGGEHRRSALISNEIEIPRIVEIAKSGSFTKIVVAGGNAALKDKVVAALEAEGLKPVRAGTIYAEAKERVLNNLDAWKAKRAEERLQWQNAKAKIVKFGQQLETRTEKIIASAEDVLASAASLYTTTDFSAQSEKLAEAKQHFADAKTALNESRVEAGMKHLVLAHAEASAVLFQLRKYSDEGFQGTLDAEEQDETQIKSRATRLRAAAVRAIKSMNTKVLKVQATATAKRLQSAITDGDTAEANKLARRLEYLVKLDRAKKRFGAERLETLVNKDVSSISVPEIETASPESSEDLETLEETT